MFRVEHNVTTGEIKEISLTAEEIAENQILQAEAAEKAVTAQAETAAKAAQKQAVLDTLGITAEQAKLLLS